MSKLLSMVLATSLLSAGTASAVSITQLNIHSHTIQPWIKVGSPSKRELLDASVINVPNFANFVFIGVVPTVYVEADRISISSNFFDAQFYSRSASEAEEDPLVFLNAQVPAKLVSTPIPAGGLLLGSALIGLAVARRRAQV